MIKAILLILMVSASTQAFAADGGIPMAFIKLQLMNFAVFAGLVIFLSRSKVAPAFKQMKEDYLSKSQEAERKLAMAKEERDSLVNKISVLEKDFQSTLVKAEEQAEIKYKAKIAEVKQSIQAMNKDLEGQIASLKRSQVTQLKNLLMEKSIEELKADLGSEVDEKLLLQLQNSFVESVVRA